MKTNPFRRAHFYTDSRPEDLRTALPTVPTSRPVIFHLFYQFKNELTGKRCTTDVDLKQSVTLCLWYLTPISYAGIQVLVPWWEHTEVWCVPYATCLPCVREGVDKSLARPGRKQATVTKLGIYSTYPLRNSIHIRSCPSNQVSAAAMTSASDEKWQPIDCFSVQGTGGSPTAPDPENRVGDQENGSPGRPVSSGLQVSGEPAHYRARTRSPGDLPAVFFLQNVLQLYQ